jgi:hypothetical protein
MIVPCSHVHVRHVRQVWDLSIASKGHFLSAFRFATFLIAVQGWGGMNARVGVPVGCAGAAGRAAVVAGGATATHLRGGVA